MAEYGSPGAAWISAKEIVATRKTSETPCAARRARKRSTRRRLLRRCRVQTDLVARDAFVRRDGPVGEPCPPRVGAHAARADAAVDERVPFRLVEPDRGDILVDR